MFDIQTQLFEGRDIRFGPIDYEKDPEIESKWTHDSGSCACMKLILRGPCLQQLSKNNMKSLKSKSKRIKISTTL